MRGQRQFLAEGISNAELCVCSPPSRASSTEPSREENDQIIAASSLIWPRRITYGEMQIPRQGGGLVHAVRDDR